MTDINQLLNLPDDQVPVAKTPAVGSDGKTYVATLAQIGSQAPPSTVPGPANTLTIGTVTTLPPGSQATAALDGTSPAQALSLGLVQGPVGPTPQLGIGTVTSGTTPAASFTGPAEAPMLNLTLQQGIQGVQGIPGSTATIASITGLWNASTNTPAFSNGGGGSTVGKAYAVSSGGTTALDGVTSWAVGDIAYNTGTAWVKYPNTGPMGAFNSLAVAGKLQVSDNGDGLGYRAFVDQFNSIMFYVDGTATQIANLVAPAGSIQSLSAGTVNILQQIALTDSNSDVILGANTATGVLQMPGVTSKVVPNTPFSRAWADDLGQIFLQVLPDGTVQFAGSGSGPVTTYQQEEIDFRDARNLAYSAKVRSNYDTVAARSIYGFNHIVVWSQSLGSGWEGWPALTFIPLTDAMMIGQSIRPAGESATTWTPLGSSTLSPLVATNQTNSATNGPLLTAAQVEALAPGDFTLGETMLESGTHMFRKLQLQMRGLQSDPSRKLVVSSCGVGGQSIEQLSKGATPNLYNRLLTCAMTAKGIAAQASQTYGIAAFVFLQGENNYIPPSGSTSNGPAYLALMQTLFANMIADLASPGGISGQADPPAFFIYQTHTSTDTDSMGIGMAQFQAAIPGPWGKQAIPSCYLFAPDYPVTNKDVHLDPNGYRWMGQQLAKVMHKVLTMGEGWYPLHPTQITYRGTEVLIDFHVPEPPLVFDMPWSGNEATSLEQISVANQGFAMADANGTITISSVSLASGTSVRVKLTRAPVGGLTVKYADFNDAGGKGGLRDSDPTVALFDYEYNVGTGQYAVANQPTMNNLPYPLWNWCIAFWMTATAD